MPQPLGGIWAGLAKTLPQEIPNCNVRVLDVAEEDFTNLHRILIRELYRWGLFEIGYRGGVRYTLSATREESRSLTPIGPDDTVLLSGGGRGIGFALACSLAREYRCRVVITGRKTEPQHDEPVVTMGADEFKVRQQAMLRAAVQAGNLPEVRGRIAREKEYRELFGNLQQAAAEGLPVEYRKCDVTSEAEVRGVVESIGNRLTVVVHNAGVDSPVRLPLKSPDTFIDTVRVKVAGFLNLLRAVEGRKLKVFCNVGSLTGRWGGMTGETDYAAANEGLSRLGMWAGRNRPFPVKTLCWPTWERLGMIKNFDIASKYMSPLPVGEGLRLWRNELNAAQSAEVTFVGGVGRALNPLQIKGFPPAPGLANIQSLYTQFHHLGDVISFRPFRSIRTRNVISADTAPLLHEVQARGKQTLPVSVLLERLAGVGSWVQAEGWKELIVHEICDVVIRLHGLTAKQGVCEFEHHAEGSWAGQDWQVRVTIADISGGATIAEATLIYRAAPLLAESIHAGPADAERQVKIKDAEWVWRGMLIPPARWSSPEPGTWVGTATPCQSSDLWSVPCPPLLWLPVAHLENIFRAALAEGRRPVDCLRIGTIRFARSSGPAHMILGRPFRQKWTVADEGAHVCLQIAGLEFYSEDSSGDYTDNERVSTERR